MRKYLAILLAAVLALTLPVIASAAPDPGTALPARGDLNGYEGVNANDIQALYDYLTNGDIPDKLPYNKSDFPTMADFNGDGRVDILDYQALYVYVVAISGGNSGGGNSEWSPWIKPNP